MNRGYVKLYRKALDSGLIQHAKAWQFLSWCLLSATHKPHKTLFNGALFSLEPGQFVTSREEACSYLGLTPKEFRCVVKLLENTDFLTSKGANKGTVLTIVNWRSYQDGGPAEGPTKGQQEGQQEGQVGANKGPARRGLSKYKQEQKNKKNKSIIAPCPSGHRAEGGTLVCDKGLAKDRTANNEPPPREDLTAYYLPVKSPEMSKVAYIKAENWSTWTATYGEDMCLTCLKDAYRWSLDSPEKAKTPRGIHKFLGDWIAREQNKPRARASPSRCPPKGVTEANMDTANRVLARRAQRSQQEFQQRMEDYANATERRDAENIGPDGPG